MPDDHRRNRYEDDQPNRNVYQEHRWQEQPYERDREGHERLETHVRSRESRDNWRSPNTAGAYTGGRYLEHRRQEQPYERDRRGHERLETHVRSRESRENWWSPNTVGAYTEFVNTIHNLQTDQLRDRERADADRVRAVAVEKAKHRMEMLLSRRS